MHPFFLVLFVCYGISLLSEFTSNVATASIALPVLAAIATTLDMHPYQLMIPATIAASTAFMMPVGTPPNAVVFSSGRIAIADMVRVGAVMQIFAIPLIVIMCWWMLPLLFGYSAP